MPHAQLIVGHSPATPRDVAQRGVACRSLIKRVARGATVLTALAATFGCEALDPTLTPLLSPPTSSSPSPVSPPLCGVENAERVAGLYCGSYVPECESVVNCCQAEGYGGTVDECVVKLGAECREGVRASLAAGACFHPRQFTEECRNLFIDSTAQCSLPEIIRAADRQFEVLGCDRAWSRGNLADGEPCSTNQQCATPGDTNAYCFPDFGGDDSVDVCHLFNRRYEGESCAGEDDSCVDPLVCSSEGICIHPLSAGESCGDALFECNSFLCEEGVCTEFVGRECFEDFDCGGFGACREGRCIERPFGSEPRCDF